MEGMEGIAHNPPALKQQRDRLQKRGFSLIEAAFVLAVVGAVIGTIWVAAAAMYEDYKVSKTVSDLALIVKNVQGLISFRDSEAIGHVVNITGTLVSAGVFPNNWVSGSNVKSPLDGNVQVNNLISSGAIGARFDFILSDVTVSECSKLVVKISSMGQAKQSLGTSYWKDTLGLIQVRSSLGLVLSWDTFPVNPSIAAGSCKSGMDVGGLYLIVTYGYTRIN